MMVHPFTSFTNTYRANTLLHYSFTKVKQSYHLGDYASPLRCQCIVT